MSTVNSSLVLPQAGQVRARGWAGSFVRLLRSDLFKLWHRPLTWALIAVTLFFVLGAYLTLIYTITNHMSAVLPGHLFGDDPAGLRNVIVQQLTLGRRVGQGTVVAMAGAVIGIEFSSGSLRVVLGRGVRRWQVLLAKYAALCVFALVLVVMATLEATLLAALLPVVVHGAPPITLLNGSSVVSIVGSDAGILENWAGVIALGSALAIIGRSAAVGIGGGLIYLVGEDLAGRVLPAMSFETHIGLWARLVDFLFTPNLNAFFYHSIPFALARELDFLDGVMPNPMVTAPHALVVGVVWIVGLLLISTALFARRSWGS